MGYLSTCNIITLVNDVFSNSLQMMQTSKMTNKQRLAQYIERVTGENIDPNSLFDIQVKRIHEYKRQLLNIMGAIYRYKKLKVRLSNF